MHVAIIVAFFIDVEQFTQSINHKYSIHFFTYSTSYCNALWHPTHALILPDFSSLDFAISLPLPLLVPTPSSSLSIISLARLEQELCI
jgi:hypothetical protein